MTKQLKSVFIIALVVAAIAAFFWVAKNLGGGEGVKSEKPAVVCRPQNAPPVKQECFWTAHIHAHVEVYQNGNRMPLKFEQGKLEGSHTHSENDKIHWHGLIPVDPITKEIKNQSALEVKNLAKDLNLPERNSVKFIVNNQSVDPSYIWKDGDHIEIHYEE